MLCPKCGADSYCVDTRVFRNNKRKRRYWCSMCGNKFNTLEIYQESLLDLLHTLEDLNGRSKK